MGQRQVPGKRCAQSLGSPGSEGSRAPCRMAWRVRLGGLARWSRSYCLVMSGQYFKNCQQHRALWPLTCPVTLLLGGDRPRCSGHGAAGPTEAPPPSLRWGRGYSHSSHISRDNAVISGCSHASKTPGATAQRTRAATPAGARRTERIAGGEEHGGPQKQAMLRVASGCWGFGHCCSLHAAPAASQASPEAVVTQGGMRSVDMMGHCGQEAGGGRREAPGVGWGGWGGQGPAWTSGVVLPSPNGPLVPPPPSGPHPAQNRVCCPPGTQRRTRGLRKVGKLERWGART